MNDADPSQQRSRLEMIVAYLDGELSHEESLRVEKQLARNESFRQELQSFDRVWNALDELPQAEVGTTFSKTTMELVVDAADRDVVKNTQALPVRRRRRKFSTALMMAIGALLGFIVFRIGWNGPNRMLVEDLPVIQYVDVYSQFGDVDFLLQLQQVMGDKTWVPETQESDLPGRVEEFRSLSDRDSRIAWLEQLEPEERTSLRARFNRFRSLPSDQQERMLQLHHDLVGRDDAEALILTLVQYQSWLNTLDAHQQFELREMPPSRRVRQVRQMVQREQGDQELLLSPEELRELVTAIEPHVERARERVISRMSPRMREQLQQNTGFEKLAYLAWVPRSEKIRIMEHLLPVIAEALPPEKRDRFEQLPFPAQVAQLTAWRRQAASLLGPVDGRNKRNRNSKEVSQQELEEFFDTGVDAATKERLLAMPRDKMEQHLRRLYFGSLPRHEWGGQRRDRPPRPGPPPRWDDRRGEHRPPPIHRGDRRPPSEFGPSRRPRDDRRRGGFGPPREDRRDDR